jgi:hypothetical protein
MGFNSGGVYTPATGATTAAPGVLIQSAVWNSIFTDLSSALTLLGQQLYGTTSVTGATYVPASNDALLLVNRAGTVAINLPSASSRAGYPLTIKDISGAAQANNITINRNGSDTIEGLTSLIINAAWGAYRLIPVSGGWIISP